MTKKRYRKMVYALIQKMNKDCIDKTGTPASKIGRGLKGCLRLEYANMDKTKVSSYAEAWEMLKFLREPNGM